MTAEIHSNSTAIEHKLPEDTNVANFIAEHFLMLGGQMIDDGTRHSVSMPEPAWFRLQSRELPQLPGANPWERLHSDQEWRGALKVAAYFMQRLSDSDREFVFGLYSSSDERRRTPTN